ncbi:MAG TPA: hypothetical protein VF718_07195 [Allosphingosinicella sp.]|jgi:hypothetical protein
MPPPLLRRIEAFLKRSGMRPTDFGRRAVRDGLFVAELRRGRKPRPGTVARVGAFLDRAELELGGRPARLRRVRPAASRPSTEGR